MGTLRPRQAWGLGVMVAVVGLLAVVAVVADGTPLRAADDDGSTDLGSRLASALEVAVLVGGVLVLVILILSMTGERNRRPNPAGRRTLWRTIVMVVAFVLISLALNSLRKNEHRPVTNQTPAGSAQIAEEPPGSGSDRPTWPLLVLGTVVVGALAWATWSARRRRDAFDAPASVSSEDSQRAAAGSAFTASLTDLEAETDPRLAIIAAYARLLDGLDVAGFGRRPAEAPEEHLRRTLAELHVSDGPMRTLVALFAEARFSEHPLTATDKQTAIDAFRAARDDLAGLATAGGGPT